MAGREPDAELDPRFSSEGAVPTAWSEAEAALEQAELFWLSTVREDGRPHVTPLLAVWLDAALWFCTGPTERKARNLAANRQCTLTTGCNSLREGLDIVVDGDARRVTDEDTLRRVATLYESKYGPEWRFEVRDGAFRHGEASLRADDPGTALVFEVVPRTAFGFRKGNYSQTRWRFGPG